MKIEIKHLYEAKILFECEADSFKLGIELAVKNKVSLRGANLRGANLRGANLCGANLRGANLCGADLCDADLRGANLCGANLCGADLRGANLCDADLCDANLGDLKKDYFERLAIAKHEVVGLYKAIMEGRIDGSSYSGECACFVGTIANIRKEDPKHLGIDLLPDSSCPTEKWFLAIRKGDTPQNNSVSKITAEWTEEFLKEQGIKVPVMEVIWKAE